MAETTTYTETKRLELHDILKTVLGSENVYFQPPRNDELKYPCIIYFRSPNRTFKADDTLYLYRQGYTITLVEYDPDSDISQRILSSLNFSRIDSFYRSGGLNHTKLTVYY